MKKRTSTLLKSEAIAKALRDRILSGELIEGVRLAQDSIAEEFGTSHIPVREALRLLASEGLVEVRPQRGAVVSTLDTQLVGELLEIRGLLEVQAMRWALVHLTDRDVSQAEAILSESEATDDIELWLSSNWRFHQMIYRLSGRETLMTMLNLLNHRIERVIRVLISNTDYRFQAQAEHRAILAALAVRNETAAVSLLEQHLEETRLGLTNLLNQFNASKADGIV
jgi:DNA-binding GntR family transcriptional regulator